MMQPVSRLCLSRPVPAPIAAAVSVNKRIVGLEYPHLAAVFFHAYADPVSLVGLRIEDCNVGDVDAGLPFVDSTLATDVGVRLGMTLHHVDAGNQHTAIAQQAGDLATL